MEAGSKTIPCLIIGAGLCGLVAARKLQGAGIQPVILESASSVGGRMLSGEMATSEDLSSEAGVYDIGAQFFTVRDPRFGKMVTEWNELGLVKEWSRGFAAGDGTYYKDGYPRYRGHPTMDAIPTYLVEGLPVILNHHVDVIIKKDKRWEVITDTKIKLSARSLIMTPPVPISLSILPPGIGVTPKIRQSLKQISFDPCLAMVVQTEERMRLPEPGGMWPIGEPIDWLADNYQKGVSPIAGIYTVHAGPDFSRSHWNSDDETICHLLLAAAQPWIGSSMIKYKIHRWRHSKPLWTYPDPCLGIHSVPPLVLAGDAFAGPRIEGAALSGLAAAEWLLGISGQ